MTLPSIESLRCFEAAARFLNFRAAARSVALTPAAFGQRIRQLEDELGEVLFIRTTRSVRLSIAGVRLLPRAKRALDAVAECASSTAASGELPPMSLLVGTRHELGVSWLLPQIDRLDVAHPFLDLNLYFGSGGDLINRVRNGDIDCAVTSSAIADPKVDAIRLHREEYVFVGASSLLATTPLRKVGDAAHHTLVDSDDSLPLFRYWREAPNGQPLPFAKLSRFGTIEAMHVRIRQGAGVGVLPTYLVRRDLERRRLKVLFPNVTPLHDWFRLVFRAQDSRRAVFELLGKSLAAAPLR